MKFVSGVTGRQLVTVIGAFLRREEMVVIDRPQALAALASRHSNPDHKAATAAQLARNAVDIGNDADDRRNLADIEILHVDYEQRGLGGIKTIEHVESAALRHHAINHILRKAIRVAHESPLRSGAVKGPGIARSAAAVSSCSLRRQ